MSARGAAFGGCSKMEIYDSANRDPLRRGYDFDVKLFCRLMDVAARTYPALEQAFETNWRQQLLNAKRQYDEKKD